MVKFIKTSQPENLQSFHPTNKHVEQFTEDKLQSVWKEQLQQSKVKLHGYTQTVGTETQEPTPITNPLPHVTSLEGNNALSPNERHTLRQEALRSQKHRINADIIQLEEVLFQESDGFTVRVAENLNEAIKLLEAGFEYVTDMTNGEGSSNIKILRKRK